MLVIRYLEQKKNAMKTNKWIVSGFALVAMSFMSINANAQSAISKLDKKELKEASVQVDAAAPTQNVKEVSATNGTTTTEAKTEKAPVVRTSRKARLQSVNKSATRAEKPKHTEAVE